MSLDVLVHVVYIVPVLWSSDFYQYYEIMFCISMMCSICVVHLLSRRIL